MRFRALDGAGGCRPRNGHGTLRGKWYPAAFGRNSFTTFYLFLLRIGTSASLFSYVCIPAGLCSVDTRIKGGVMNIKRIRAYLVMCSLVVVLQPLQALAPQNSNPPKTDTQSTERRGQNHFDPPICSLKYHPKPRLPPLTRSTTWVEFDGTGVC